MIWIWIWIRQLSDFTWFSVKNKSMYLLEYCDYRLQFHMWWQLHKMSLCTFWKNWVVYRFNPDWLFKKKIKIKKGFTLHIPSMFKPHFMHHGRLTVNISWTCNTISYWTPHLLSLDEQQYCVPVVNSRNSCFVCFSRAWKIYNKHSWHFSFNYSSYLFRNDQALFFWDSFQL